MRILKTVQSYFPFQDRGGTVFKVRSIARALAQRGHQVTILTADLGIRRRNPNGNFERCEWGWRCREEGVETIYLSTRARYRAVTLSPSAIRFCRTSLERFDLVHIYGLYDLLGPAAAHFCRRMDVPYVLEPMGMYRPIARNLALKRTYHRFLGARLVSGARRVIATSEQERRELVAAGIDPQHLAVRRNGIEVPEALPPRGEFRDKWSLPADAKVVLFLGRIVSKKRPDLLIQAFADWQVKSRTKQSAFLVVAGPDEGDGYISHVKALARSLHIFERVLFVGPLYDEEKWRAYRDADVFVLPSENENFGNTAAEAVACGTPVILTDCCGVAPFLDRAAMVVRPVRGELAAALERIFSDPDFYQRCREACAGVASGLSWDAPVSELEQLYEQCCLAPLPQQIVA